MKILYRLLLTFNATSLILVIYLVKTETKINLVTNIWCCAPNYISYIIYSLVPIILTYFSLLLTNLLSNDVIQRGSIIEVEQANNVFLPSYLGYFFVALSVPNCDTLLFVFFILFVFTFLSQTLYFNPLFLFFGYNFYNVSTSNNIKIFIVSKKTIKNPNDIEFKKLKRINNFTFIDKENELLYSKEEENK
jgi:hypothetical protein